MKRFFTLTAATGLALSLLTAPMAMAQQTPQDHAEQHSQDSHAAPDQHAPMQTHTQMQTHAQAQNRAPQRPQGEQHAAIAPRPPAQHVVEQSSHEWRHGDHYTGNRRVVDWHRYHANPPPQGYEWVQDGNELVLISITTGIIASVLANAAYQ